MTSPQLSSPQLTSPSSSNRPDRLSSIGPSTSLEEIAAEDVQKLVAELAASSSACNTFEVIDHGTVSAPTATPLPEIPSKPFTPTPKPAVKSSDPPAKPTVKSVEPASKITAPARRGRAPNMAAKKPSRTQLKFGSMPVIQPKVEEKVDDDLDSDEMEAELLRRMCEEEDMAVMNLTTEDGDDAFGKQQQQKPAVKKEQEPVEPVKPITSLLSPAQKDVNKTEEKVTASSVATLPPVAVVAPVKLASPKPPVLTSPKRADKAKVEPVERRSSNESMESSHMGSGGGYMEIDAEHLLKQQKEQEELEKKQEQERRKAEELARMEETVEAVIAAATRSSQQQSQIPQVVPPVAGSDTTSPYQTVQMQSSIDSRTPQSESSHGGSATPLSKPPLSNYAPSVIASQGSQQGSPVVQVGSGGPVVVVQVQQQQQKPYGSNLSQMYANPQQQRKSGVIMEEKGGHAQFSTHLVQSPASHGAIGGQASNGASVASVVVSNSSSSHMAQMIQQQQQKFVHQQQDHVQRQVVSQPQQPPVTGKRGKQQVARPQNVLVPTSQSESASAQHQQQGSTQQHQGLPQQHYPNQVNQQQHPAMPQQQAVPQRQPTPQQHQANSQQQHQANPQQQQPQVQGQVAQGQVIQGQPQGPEFGGIEQQNVNRLLAFYNLNFMNPPMATVTAVQQGQTQQQHTGQHQQQYVARSMQQEPQGQQQQTASNAAANAPTTAANVPAQLAARHWSSMVSATSVTQSSASNSGLINGDPASLELFRQQHAAQMQALQTQHPTNIPGGQSSTAPGQDLLLQQHLQAQQHRQISAQQQQPQQQSQQQQQNYGTAALRTAQKVQMSQQQQGRQEVVGQAEQQQRKPSSAQMQHHQQQNAVYMAHQQHQNAALLQQQQQQHHMYPQSQQQPQQQHVSPQMQQQHNNQADPQQQRNTNEKYPVLWQGQLAMKNTDTLVQMHRVCGNDKLIDITNQELVSRANGISTIRITQRMRLEQTQLESLMKKMEKEANYVALVCLPCGRNREDITVQTSRMTTHFIDYFTSKMAAGIVNQGPITPTPSCVAHVFPPSDFATGHLNRHAPDLLVTIEKHNAGYLFVVITTNN